jgi:hypothetical protein
VLRTENKNSISLPNECNTQHIRGCIQTFPDWIDKDIYAYLWYYSLRSNTKGYGAKLTRMIHKIAIQLRLLAESCTICSSRSRRPETFGYTHVCLYVRMYVCMCVYVCISNLCCFNKLISFVMNYIASRLSIVFLKDYKFFSFSFAPPQSPCQYSRHVEWN